MIYIKKEAEEVKDWPEEAHQEGVLVEDEAVRATPVHPEVFQADQVQEVQREEAEEALSAVPAVPAAPAHQRASRVRAAPVRRRASPAPAAPVLSRAVPVPPGVFRAGQIPAVRRAEGEAVPSGVPETEVPLISSALPGRRSRPDRRGRSWLSRRAGVPDRFTVRRVHPAPTDKTMEETEIPVPAQITAAAP